MGGLTEEEKKKILPKNTILLGYVGSIAHGTYRPSSDIDSIDDKDIMGICFGHPNTYLGLEQFQQKVVRHEAGWDSIVYEIKKMIRLLLKSNPNVLSLLWLPENLYIIKEPAGQLILDHRDIFVSKQSYKAFSGYAYGQLKRMTHYKFEGYMGQKRKGLVDKFGFDCSNASHLIRLLRTGIEFLTEGVLYVHRKDASQLLEIKTGLWTLEQIKKEAERLFKLAEEAYVRSPLPVKPDYEKAQDLTFYLIRNYLFPRANFNC